MDKPAPTIKGRKIAVLVGDGVDTGEVEAMLEALSAAELVPETIGPRAGTVAASDGPMKVNRAAPNAPSVVYDAVLVPTGVGPALAAQTLAQRFVHEAWRHGKPIAVAPDAEALLEAAGVPASDDGVTVAEAAILSARLMSRPRRGTAFHAASRCCGRPRAIRIGSRLRGRLPMPPPSTPAQRRTARPAGRGRIAGGGRMADIQDRFPQTAVAARAGSPAVSASFVTTSTLIAAYLEGVTCFLLMVVYRR